MIANKLFFIMARTLVFLLIKDFANVRIKNVDSFKLSNFR